MKKYMGFAEACVLLGAGVKRMDLDSVVSANSVMVQDDRQKERDHASSRPKRRTCYT